MSRPVWAIAFALALGVGVVATIAARQDMPYGWELDGARAVHDLPDVLDRPWQALMLLGTEVGILALVGLVAVVVDRRVAGSMLLAAALAWAMVHLLKSWLDRPRPDPEVLGRELRFDARGVGFPSGHAAQTLAIALVFVALVGVARRWRLAVVLVALLVGIGRVYAGLHWPLDVLGGWAIGIVSAGSALALVRARTPETSKSTCGGIRPPV